MGEENPRGNGATSGPQNGHAPLDGYHSLCLIDPSDIRREGLRFVQSLNDAERVRFLTELEAAVRDPHRSKLGLLVAIEILRAFRFPGDKQFIRRLLLRSPQSYEYRYVLANSLLITDDRRSQVEGVKQQIIGCALELTHAERIGASTNIIQGIRERHFKRVDRVDRFLEGDRPFPTKKLKRLRSMQRNPEPATETLLPKIAGLADLAGLPALPPPRLPDITVVVDCNAISNRDAYRHFLDQRILFVTPEDVIREFSRWEGLLRVPWELDAVEVREVTWKIPTEIDAMFSPKKKKEPSLADKRVATLSLEIKADAIVSEDRDLWDSGLSIRLEKSFGHRLEVLKPDEFGKWLASGHSHPA